MGTKHYDKQFKEQAVKLSKQRGSISQVARELGVSSANFLSGARQRKSTEIIAFRGEVLNA